jgi:hypothetical protein
MPDKLWPIMEPAMLPAMDDAIVPIMPIPPPPEGCIMGGAAWDP